MNTETTVADRRKRTRSIALACAAAIMLVPANVLPILHTQTPGQARTDTIFSGIVGLYKSGLWAIGAIVFTASVLIPALKLLGLAWLQWATRCGAPVRNPRGLTQLYSALRFIGRWSMLDVFFVAFLSGAVRFGLFANVEPRPGIFAFAAAVVLTVLATAAFDPRTLWPKISRDAGTTAIP
ncbi:MAG: paraquat-inducible protein A [Opitutaceae bacterium]